MPPATLDPRTPVLVGAGQVTSRPDGLEDALDPISLMAEAVERAAADAKLSGVPAADVVRVVSLLSWRYGDPAHFLAEQLGLSPRETAVTTPGGNSPQMLVNEAALEIQRGELDLAILAGGEAWRTRMRARKAGATLTWPKLPDDAAAGPGHRPRAGHELTGRDGPGHRDARPGLPDVRDRGPGGQGRGRRRAPGRRSASCGPASRSWPPATPTRGSSRPGRPRRSARPARPTG